MSTFTISIQHSTGNPRQNNQTRKRNKRHQNLKGSKIVSVCKYDLMYRKSRIRYEKQYDTGKNPVRTDK